MKYHIFEYHYIIYHISFSAVQIYDISYIHLLYSTYNNLVLDSKVELTIQTTTSTSIIKFFCFYAWEKTNILNTEILSLKRLFTYKQKKRQKSVAWNKNRIHESQLSVLRFENVNLSFTILMTLLNLGDLKFGTFRSLFQFKQLIIEEVRNVWNVCSLPFTTFQMH